MTTTSVSSEKMFWLFLGKQLPGAHLPFVKHAHPRFQPVAAPVSGTAPRFF
jgi:hypothetical protein